VYNELLKDKTVNKDFPVRPSKFERCLGFETLS